MEEIVFKSQQELYDRIKPALRSKRRIIVKSGTPYVKEKDIWDFLRLNKWSSSNGLELCEIVDDILHIDNQLIINYCFNKYMNNNRNVAEIKEFDGVELPKLKS